MSDLKILWLDVETTGLNPEVNDVIQVAGIFDVNTIPAEEFNFYVQPFNYDQISDEALRVNGYTLDELRTFEPAHEVYRCLDGIFERYIDRYDRDDKALIGGQNPSFDRDFLKAFWNKNDDPYFGSWFDYHIVDLCSLSIVFHIKGIIDLTNERGKVSVKLENVAKAFDLEQKQPHDALDDIRLTRKIFYEYMIDRFF